MNLGLKNEDGIQAEVVQWARKKSKEMPELAWLHHVPNGGSRHPVEAMRLLALGVTKGICDLVLPCARGGYFGLYLEFKDGNKGRLSEAQKAFADFARAQGYCVGVIRTVTEGQEAILGYLGMQPTKIEKNC